MKTNWLFMRSWRRPEFRENIGKITSKPRFSENIGNF